MWRCSHSVVISWNSLRTIQSKLLKQFGFGSGEIAKDELETVLLNILKIPQNAGRGSDRAGTDVVHNLMHDK